MLLFFFTGKDIGVQEYNQIIHVTSPKWSGSYFDLDLFGYIFCPLSVKWGKNGRLDKRLPHSLNIPHRGPSGKERQY